MVTRREFVAGGAVVAGVAAASTTLTGHAAAPARAPRGPFQHGVASGDPLDDGVILWTRVTPRKPGPVPVRWRIARDERLRDVVNQGVVTALPDRDHTVKVDADGLQPGSTYHYRFEALGAESETGRTRTLPELTVTRLRFAICSCSNYPIGYFNAYARIADRADLDAVLHLGDYLYEYAPGEQGRALGRVHVPAHELVTLTDYRERHAQYKTDPDLQAAHRAHPWICVWDDHESANNAWRDGAQNHNPELGEGDWADRRAAAIRAYHEWLPIRERPGAGGPSIWRSFRFGTLADLIMLDTRLHGRTRQVADRTDMTAMRDPAHTILGTDQQAWLAEELRGSVRRGTAWHVLGQQLMFGQLLGEDGVLLNTDQWDGYPNSRRLILDQLAAESIDDTVILTGDIHSAWAMDIAPDPFGPGYDPKSGRGSLAVELVTTSVTSRGPGGDAPDLEARERQIVAAVPHIKYVNLREHGYLLLDLTAERALAEWWLVDSVTERTARERLGAAFATERGANHLVRVDP